MFKSDQALLFAGHIPKYPHHIRYPRSSTRSYPHIAPKNHDFWYFCGLYRRFQIKPGIMLVPRHIPLLYVPIIFPRFPRRTSISGGGAVPFSGQNFAAGPPPGGAGGTAAWILWAMGWAPGTGSTLMWIYVDIMSTIYTSYHVESCWIYLPYIIYIYRVHVYIVPLELSQHFWLVFAVSWKHR